jgi:hypothetical protein
MAGMSGPTGAPTAGSATSRIVDVLATAYRRQGYHQAALPASTLLAVTASRGELETALATLLDDGAIVPVGTNGVALHPGARAALLTRRVLQTWHDTLSREAGAKAALHREGLTAELTNLVAWAASDVELPDDLTQRAAELAGVLATPDLDPRAIDVVASHGGTPRGRLAALAALRPRTVAVDRLRDHLRNTVSSAFPTR